MKAASQPRRPFWRLAALTLAAGAALTASFGVRAETVKFAFPTNINLSNAPLLMADGMGYFKDEGLDVEIMFFQGSSVMMPQLTQKNITFGWMSPESLISGAQPDRTRLPVKLFYNGIYLSPYEIVVKEDSPIQQASDFAGKKIGVGGMTWANIPITKAIMNDAGLQAGKDYELLPVGVGASAFRALENDSIAGLNLFDTFHGQLENSGTKLRRLPVDDKYRKLFSNGWLAHEDTLRDNPELAVKFARAAAKGVVACQANVEACVKNFWEMYPNTKPSQGTEAQKLADAVRIVEMRLATMIPPEGVAQMGRYTRESLEDYAQVLHQGGLLSTADLPLDALYTNEFVDRINDFDANAVAAQAKAK